MLTSCSPTSMELRSRNCRSCWASRSCALASPSASVAHACMHMCTMPQAGTWAALQLLTEATSSATLAQVVPGCCTIAAMSVAVWEVHAVTLADQLVLAHMNFAPHACSLHRPTYRYARVGGIELLELPIFLTCRLGTLCCWLKVCLLSCSLVVRICWHHIRNLWQAGCICQAVQVITQRLLRG
jgi:hypothetical protein